MFSCLAGKSDGQANQTTFADHLEIGSEAIAGCLRDAHIQPIQEETIWL